LAWTIEVTHTARRDLERLDRQIAKRITRYLAHKVATSQDPRELGKPLSGKLKHLWSYRVGDYRVLCEVQEERFVVIAITIGHRREIYR
jgi:mRNA interferase RelE/StbE